jgi:hypothetical protein
MKTSIKTLISAALVAIVLTSSAFTPVSADSKSPLNTTRRIEASNFKKIIVSGNVDLLLVQNNKSGVIVNEDSRFAKLRVTQQGNTLRISSNQSERIEVTVYVNDIFRIEASEDATVKTFNKLNVQYLQVFLHDNAMADLNTQTESLYTVIDGRSKLNLSGGTNHHALSMNRISTLSMKDFFALKSEVSGHDALVMLNAGR